MGSSCKVCQHCHFLSPPLSGGLNLPCPSTIHRKLQVSCQVRLLTSRDGFLTDQGLRLEPALTRQKFKPASLVREALEVNPGGSQKALVKRAKAMVVDDSNTALLEDWQNLDQQGHMHWCVDQECSARLWREAVKALQEGQMKFVLNAALDVLPPQCQSP